MTNLQALVDERARAVKAMREYLEAGNPEADAKFNEINAEVEKLDAKIANLKKVEDAEREQSVFAQTKQPPMENIGEKQNQSKEQEEKYAKAFSAYMRKGEARLNAEESAILQAGFRKIENAAQTTTTTGGGYLIPQGFMGKLEEALKYYGGILNVVSEFQTETGNPLPWPTVNDTANVGRILGINTQTTNTGFTFGQVLFGAFVGCSDSVLVPIQLQQDSYFDLEGVVARLLGTRLGRLMNNKLTVGAGTTEPSGIVTEAIAANLKYTTASGQTTTIISDDLLELEHTVDVAYRPNAKYMFNDKTLKSIKKLKDSYGRYLWLPGLSATDPNTINGYGYVINNDMADIGTSGSPVAGNAFALFGDLSKYQVRRVAGDVTMMVLRERYADYLQVGYQAFVRFDGKLIDAGTHPIAVAVQAAS